MTLYLVLLLSLVAIQANENCNNVSESENDFPLFQIIPTLNQVNNAFNVNDNSLVGPSTLPTTIIQSQALSMLNNNSSVGPSTLPTPANLPQPVVLITDPIHCYELSQQFFDNYLKLIKCPVTPKVSRRSSLKATNKQEVAKLAGKQKLIKTSSMDCLEKKTIDEASSLDISTIVNINFIMSLIYSYKGLIAYPILIDTINKLAVQLNTNDLPRLHTLIARYNYQGYESIAQQKSSTRSSVRFSDEDILAIEKTPKYLDVQEIVDLSTYMVGCHKVNIILFFLLKNKNSTVQSVTKELEDSFIDGIEFLLAIKTHPLKQIGLDKAKSKILYLEPCSQVYKWAFSKEFVEKNEKTLRGMNQRKKSF